MFWLSAAVDALLGLLMLVILRRWRRPALELHLEAVRPPSATAHSWALVCLGLLLWLLKEWTLYKLRWIHIFGLMHTTWLAFCLALPAVGLASLLLQAWDRRRISPPPAWRPGGPALLFLPAFIGLYGSWIEPFRLQVERPEVTIPAARAGRTPLTVGVLADIQLRTVTDYERGAVLRLATLKPDVVLIPGDLWQAPRGTPMPVEELRALLAPLRPPGGTFLVVGDVDSREGLTTLTKGTPLRLLYNQRTRVNVRDWSLELAGASLHLAEPDATAFLQGLKNSPDFKGVRLLLAHRPDAVLSLSPASRVDLVVAGHTHGGQVQLPFLGPLLTLSKVPRAVAGGGLHSLDPGQRIYVSRSVGYEKGQAPRLRLFCPPEISLLTLQAGD